MSTVLMQIAPPHGQHKPLLPQAVKARLQGLYDQVPKVSCSGCDRPGQCCELTEAEWASDFATMYPLYAVEYLNIVDYVRTHYDAARQAEVLSVVDDRPRRCPFLTETGGCSIHPARPLTCRTYGVLNQARQVEAVARAVRAEGEVPKHWIAAFLHTEKYTVCAQTVLQEPDKVEAHMLSMASLDYEQQMLEMGRSVDWLDEDRRAAFLSVSGKSRPIRWTWGGFNALLQTPLAWLKAHFETLWRRSFLGE